MIGTIATICESSAPSKSVPIEAEVDERVPVLVKSDELRLKQVLVNLVANALKFTSEGLVKIQVGIDEAVVPPCLRIAVVDSGIGLSEEEQEQVFLPFQQADSGLSREYDGVGLGLSIAHRLTHLMGGAIEVSSQKGAGATFVVRLPLQPVDAIAPAPVETEEPPARPLSILIVEDSETNRRVLLKMLEREGFEAETAENGAVAVDAVLQNSFDLVFMDLHMPVMDGYEAIQQIRASEGVKQPRIVVVSANVLPADVSRSSEVGGDDFIPKPVDRRRLAQVLRHAAAHR